MSNHFKIPKANPFRFIKVRSTPGIHFNSDWACARVKNFETKRVYRQKWLRPKTTKVQVESSIAPQDLMVLDQDGAVVKSIAWAVIFAEPSYSVYEAEVDFTDLDEGVHYLYALVDFMAISWAMITEPIHVKDDWGPNLLMLRYYNTFNDFDLVFSNGLQLYFFVEAAVMNHDPDGERTSYVNQTRDVETLKGVPGEKCKLWVGEAEGVADWVPTLLDRIFSCDRVYLSAYGTDDELRYERPEGNAKWEITRVKGYPLVGAVCDLVVADNTMSEEFSDTAPLSPGLVVAYEVETDFWGPAATVQVTEVEENG